MRQTTRSPAPRSNQRRKKNQAKRAPDAAAREKEKEHDGSGKSEDEAAAMPAVIRAPIPRPAMRRARHLLQVQHRPAARRLRQEAGAQGAALCVLRSGREPQSYAASHCERQRNDGVEGGGPQELDPPAMGELAASSSSTACVIKAAQGAGPVHAGGADRDRRSERAAASRRGRQPSWRSAQARRDGRPRSSNRDRRRSPSMAEQTGASRRRGGWLWTSAPLEAPNRWPSCSIVDRDDAMELWFGLPCGKASRAREIPEQAGVATAFEDGVEPWEGRRQVQRAGGDSVTATNAVYHSAMVSS